MISVIIPVYDAEPYLRQAVESALAQEETGEVILIEDNSPDNSLKVCKDLESEYTRVRLLRHPDGQNHGISKSRNLGILNAKYDYIAFLDSDDYYLPDRFKVAMKILYDNPDADGVYEATGVHFESESLEKQWIEEGKSNLTTVRESVSPEVLFEAMLGGKGWFLPDGIVVRKYFIIKCGMFNEQLRLGEDTAMWIKMAAMGQLVAGRLDEAVSIRRVHGGNWWFVTTNENIIIMRIMLWKIMWKWGKNNDIDSNRLDLLLRRWLNCEVSYYNKYPVIIRNILKIYQLAALLMKELYIIKSPVFWSVLVCSSGIFGLKHRLCKLVNCKFTNQCRL